MGEAISRTVPRWALLFLVAVLLAGPAMGKATKPVSGKKADLADTSTADPSTVEKLGAVAEGAERLAKAKQVPVAKISAQALIGDDDVLAKLAAGASEQERAARLTKAGAASKAASMPSDGDTESVIRKLAADAYRASEAGKGASAAKGTVAAVDGDALLKLASEADRAEAGAAEKPAAKVAVQAVDETAQLLKKLAVEAATSEEEKGNPTATKPVETKKGTSKVLSLSKKK